MNKDATNRNGQDFHCAMGQVLQSARVSAGLSSARVAEACGLSGADVLGFERGETALDVYTLHRLSTALGVTTPAMLEAAIRAYEERITVSEPDRETQEAGELIRRFLHVEGASRGEKFIHLVNELKKDD